MLNLDQIANHLIFLHGTSGSGKSTVQESITAYTRYYKYNDIKVIYLSSGDCFRELMKSNPEIAGQMRSGQFIATLDKIMPILENKIYDFVTQLIACQKEGKDVPMLMLDGFLRMGAYKDGDITVPSQIDQVAGAFKRVVTKIVKETEEGGKNIDPEIVNMINQQDITKLWREEIPNHLRSDFKEMIVNSHHYYVDVTREDAEKLMRFRSEKAFTQVLTLLKGKRGKLGELREELKTGLSVQLGKFKLLDKKNDFHLKEVPKERHAILDKEMARVTRKICKIAGMEYTGANLSLTSAVKKIAQEKGIDLTGIQLRDDDLTFKSREKRIKEFREKTIPSLLIDELGFSQREDGILIPPQGERSATFVNGPERNIGYNEFQRSTYPLAENVLIQVKVGDTRHIYGESSSFKRSKEAA